MSSDDPQPMELLEFRVEATPAVVPAGGQVRLQAFVTSLYPLDPGARTVQVFANGEQKAELILEPQGDGSFESPVLAIDVPEASGEHRLDAHLDVDADSGTQAVRFTTAVTYAVAAHRVTLTALKVPTAVPLGEPFEVTVGAKCACGCSLSGQPIIVSTESHGEHLRVKLGDETWPGTEAVYYSNAQLQAPETEGLVSWEVRLEPEGLPLPHEAEPASFTAHSVPPPEHELRVEAFDRDKQTPIKGASVVLHPFRAVTDENGFALMKVPSGEHTLFVSGFRYHPFRSSIRVDGDAEIRADLLWEEEEESYDQHY